MQTTLRHHFRWHSDPPRWPAHRVSYADVSGWWRNPDLLAQLGPMLGGLFPKGDPTVVMGVQSRGLLLGPLVAIHLGVGFVEVRKGAERAAHTDQWFVRTTAPDYCDEQQELAVRRAVLRGTDRVLFVDEWIATGAQATACRQLVADAGADWIGAAVIVDGLDDAEPRRRLPVRSLLRLRDLED
ncbi:phosphoribosyltransferase family protein [Allobranchiibius huperziae]|nr:phosphoribosyltransferase family protein [Allobranchiibius huperziae]